MDLVRGISRMLPESVREPKIDDEPVTLRIATAIARDRALVLHVRQAMRLVELTADRVEPTRALEIHFRIHRLRGVEAQYITTQALARLAARLSLAPPEAPEISPPPGVRTAVDRILRRLRGRRDPELRRIVEMLAAETDILLIQAHARGALHFWELFGGRDDESAVVELYLDQAQMPNRLRGPVRALALERLAALRLPREPRPLMLPVRTE